jgi:hypothetical protein
MRNPQRIVTPDLAIIRQDGSRNGAQQSRFAGAIAA